MIGYAFVGLTIYLLFKRNPQQSKELVSQAHTFLKYLPIDRNAINLVNPILSSCENENPQSINRIISSGKTSTKRSVSETKKNGLHQNNIGNVENVKNSFQHGLR